MTRVRLWMGDAKLVAALQRRPSPATRTDAAKLADFDKLIGVSVV
jgi:hypothetical protein